MALSNGADKRIYLDYAATTPVDAEVMRAMAPYFSGCFGNPSSTHWDGQRASAAVFAARQTIARALGADYKDIIFTGSATEANNGVVHGVVRKFFESDTADGIHAPYRIIVSAIEHESVMEPCRVVEQEYGVEVVRIPVNHEGIIDVQKVKAALNERTLLVSVQYANSEIGVIQPIQQISQILADLRDLPCAMQDAGISDREFLHHTSKTMNQYPLFHTDAVQAFQFLSCNAHELGVDLVTLSAHKIYGPKGIGCLYVRGLSAKSYQLKAFITGGGQEFGMRAGTENVPGIVGCEVAICEAERVRKKEAARLIKLRDYFWRALQKIAPDAEMNGSLEARLPNNANVYFPGRSAQDMVIEFDLMGMAVSPGTACSSRTAQPSSVIEALGASGGGGDRPSSSIRFSLGRPTTKEEIDAALTMIQQRFKK